MIWYTQLYMNTKLLFLVFPLLVLTGGITGFIVGRTTVEPAPMSMTAMMKSMNANLEGKTGDALDKAFLEEMIMHHEGAVEMAKMLEQGTQRSEMKTFAQSIINAQSGEITQMKVWLQQWFGSNDPHAGHGM